MGHVFAGLTFTAVFLAGGIVLLRKKPNNPKAVRIAAILTFIAGCGLVGSWFQGFATRIAAALPPAVVAFAAVFCALGFAVDCWGKQNKAGKPTVIIGFFVPLLVVVAPVSLLGIDPGDLIQEVKGVTQDTQIVQTTTR